MKVLFLEEELDEKLLEAGVNVPVEKAEIVADHVVAEVRELGGLASAFGQTVAVHLSGEDFFADQGELVDPGQKIGIEENFFPVVHNGLALVREQVRVSLGRLSALDKSYYRSLL